MAAHEIISSFTFILGSNCKNMILSPLIKKKNRKESAVYLQREHHNHHICTSALGCLLPIKQIF